MSANEFRDTAAAWIDWIARYLESAERYPVLSRVKPGDVRAALPSNAPLEGEPMDVILRDFERLLLPGLTHWNHPRFFAYFGISATAPGILAELLTAAVNQQAMLWRTSPAATELEEVALGWLRQLIGLPESFEGVIYDGGSSSNLHALLAARSEAIPRLRNLGLAGRTDLPTFRVYCSEQAHSSVDKAMLVLGLGQQSLRKITVDGSFRMRPDALRAAIAADRAVGVQPMAVVATVGTTSTASVDPIDAIADICQTEGVWLHVDGSYGGAAAILPDYASVLRGAERADSLVVNPHKWLFTPLDLSAFYCRRMSAVCNSVSLTPDYLETPETDVRNLMDTGIALGRRFRALKLWTVMRYYGSNGLRERITEHIRLAALFANWIETSLDFELLAPVSLSVVCFRAAPRSLRLERSALDRLNSTLLDHVNASGELFISHTRLNGCYSLRLAIGNARTSEKDVARAWQVLQDTLATLLPG